MRTLLLATALALTCGLALAVEYPTDWSAGFAGNPAYEIFVDSGSWVDVWQNCDPGYGGEYVIEDMSGYRYVSLVAYGGPSGNSPWKDYNFYWPYSWQFQQEMGTGQGLFSGDPGDWCILEFGGGTWYDTTNGQYFDPTPEQMKFTIIPEPALTSSLAGLLMGLGGIASLRLRRS
jgi:hypothetical protein